MEILMISP